MSNHAFARLGNAIRKRWQLSQDIRRLEALDDRTLADIGVRRSELRSMVINGRPAR